MVGYFGEKRVSNRNGTDFRISDDSDMTPVAANKRPLHLRRISTMDTPQSQEIELQARYLSEQTASNGAEGGRDEEDTVAGDQRGLTLPPIEGREAWIFVACAFSIEFMCYGGSFSWSIFQDYLMRSESSSLKNESGVTISAIGTLLLSTLYFSPPLTGPLLKRYPDLARKISFIALLLAGSSLLIASFLQTAPALLIFVGLFHGIGAAPYITYIPQWFTKRRSLANGIAYSGAGTGGLIFPFVFTTTLDKLGFAWTLRIWSAIFLVGGGTALYFMKPRLPPIRPPTTTREHSRAAALKLEFAYLFSPLWAMNALLTFMASAGLFAVSFYLATYCSSLGLGSAATSGTVAAFNAAGLLGEISIGYACDRLAYPLVILSIGSIGGLSTFLLLGFARSLSTVVVFTLIFGWAAGSWCATWSASCLDIARLRKIPIDSVIMSMIFVRGVAALIGPLVAAGLYQSDMSTSSKLFGSFGFGPLIDFVGSCMLGVAVIGSVLGLTRKRIMHGFDTTLLSEAL
ncbi:major facilitator superfamily domain-containing protein [Mycena crocata]|nr:major facilitator superfamily domain-containing protein [Mycena crocata]